MRGLAEIYFMIFGIVIDQDQELDKAKLTKRYRVIFCKTLSVCDGRVPCRYYGIIRMCMVIYGDRFINSRYLGFNRKLES